jgi:hypothetical protein
MDSSNLLLAAGAALLINALILYYIVRSAVKDALAKMIISNQDLLALKKLELQRSGASEKDIRNAIEIGKLDARLKSFTISQRDYDAERTLLEASN